jgi:hypothetical protein
MLQAPQFALSDEVSTQVLPHSESPALQTHAPPAQCSPVPHTLPQAPQLLLSFWSAMQAPLQ